jgi:hypothetical protein
MLNPSNEYAPFVMASGWDISEETRKAQRFFEKSYDIAVNPGTVTNVGNDSMLSSSNGYTRIKTVFRVEKRATPVGTFWSPRTSSKNGFVEHPAGVDLAVSPTYVGTTGMTCVLNNTGANNSDVLWQWTAESEL